MAIIDVQTKRGFYYIHDGTGSETPPSTALRNLIGIGIDFLVLEKGGFYYTFDEKDSRLGYFSRPLDF